MCSEEKRRNGEYCRTCLFTLDREEATVVGNTVLGYLVDEQAHRYPSPYVPAAIYL